MKLYFNKFKLTESLFSRRLETSIEEIDNKIIVNVFPHLAFCGEYIILEIKENKTFGMLRYITQFKNQIFYIDIAKAGKKVSIYNDRKEGVILKK